MLACLLWGIFLVIIIAIMCCLMPWWLVLLIVGGGFIYSFLLSPDSLFKIDTKQYKPKKKRKKTKNQGKANDANIGAGTLLAGAALAHQMRKHHKHDDSNDITDKSVYAWDDGMDELYDEELDDIYDLEDNADYDNEIAAYEEEQAAYDDFIASMDMAED